MPAFQIVGSSIEFYLRCMVCNPNGFQFVLAYEFEACPTPFRGSSSAPFSVYSRMENHGMRDCRLDVPILPVDR